MEVVGERTFVSSPLTNSKTRARQKSALLSSIAAQFTEPAFFILDGALLVRPAIISCDSTSSLSSWNEDLEAPPGPPSPSNSKPMLEIQDCKANKKRKDTQCKRQRTMDGCMGRLPSINSTAGWRRLPCGADIGEWRTWLQSWEYMLVKQVELGRRGVGFQVIGGGA